MNTEKQTEVSFKRWLKKHTKHTYYFKLSFIGWAGAPDRLLVGNGFHVFIEWKRPGKKVGLLQNLVHEILKKGGLNVVVCYTKEEAIKTYEILSQKIR